MKANIRDGVLLCAELEDGERELVIPEGVTAIGMTAFALNRQIRRLTLPKSLRYIGPAAFSGCKELEELRLYAGVRAGTDAFGRCDSLRRLELFPQEQEIEEPERAFNRDERVYAPAVREVVLHEGITTTKGLNLAHCKALESVTLPSTLRTLASSFCDCTALERISLPDGIETIGMATFSGCTALKRIDLPAGLREIKIDAFKGCTALERIDLPAGVREIEAGAFEGCTALEYAGLHAGLREIENSAFKGCTALRQISLPAGLRGIGSSAFEGCTALERVDVSDGLKTIWRRAFEGCTALRQIGLPDSLTEIYERAFYGCTTLRLTVPASVETVETSAFANVAEVAFLGDPPRNNALQKNESKYLPMRVRARAGTKAEQLARKMQIDFETLKEGGDA